MYAIQKVQVFSTYHPPENHFSHELGHRRAGAVKGSLNASQNTTIEVNGVEHQETANIKKL